MKPIDSEYGMVPAKAWANDEARMRQREAQTWRKARARLASYTDRERAALLAYWQRCSLPADPEYFLTMMHMHDTGRLDMNPPVFRQTEECRQKVRATIERLISRQIAWYKQAYSRMRFRLRC